MSFRGVIAETGLDLGFFILTEKLQAGFLKWNIGEGASFTAGKRTTNNVNTAVNLRKTFLKDD